MKWQEGHCSRGTGVPGMYLRDAGGSGGASAVDISRLMDEGGKAVKIDGRFWAGLIGVRP